MRYLKILESIAPNNYKVFTDSEISYYNKLWNSLNLKYTNNQFFSSLWSKVLDKKRLTKNQWRELEFLLKNGKSRYESGILPSNY